MSRTRHRIIRSLNLEEESEEDDDDADYSSPAFDDSSYRSFDDYSSHTVDDEPRAPTGTYVLLAVIVIVLLYWCIPLNFSKAPSVPSNKLILDLHTASMTNFDGDKRVKAVLTYIFDVLLNTDIKAPVVILLVGKDNATAKFLNPLKRLLRDHYRSGSEPLDYTILSDRPPDRRQLERRIANYLGVDARHRVTILRHIDFLTSTTPLFLHAISDPDTAPYKHLLLVGTLSPPESSRDTFLDANVAEKVQRRECDERVSNHLLRTWGADLKPDKIHPIISRISAILLCLD